MEAWASPCLHRRERCLVTRRISVGFARDPMEALESPSGASSIEEKRWRCPMADDDFEFRIGRSTADRSLNRELLLDGHRAGRQVLRSLKGRRFTGERSGRGWGVGRLISSSDRFARLRARPALATALRGRLWRKGGGAGAAPL